MNQTLDEIDKLLLQLMQAEARQPVAQLADSVGLSVPACYKRINKLRVSGVIEREVAVVSPKVFGWTLQMIVLVALERERANMSHTLIQKIKKHRQILAASYVTGDYDFVVTIVAKDMDDYEDLTRKLFYSDMNIKNFKTLVVMRNVK